MTTHITIIGAGPRGLTLAERLLTLSHMQSIAIDLYDPAPLGGRVWNPYLPANQLYLMNTYANQVTLFNDKSVADGRCPNPGPNLLEWAQTHARDYLTNHPEFSTAYQEELSQLNGIDTFTSRGLMGVYAAWYYEWLQSQQGQNHQLNYHQTAVVDLQPVNKVYQLTLTSGQKFKTDVVIMALGHLDQGLNSEEEYLNQHNHAPLRYWPPKHPAESDFKDIKPNEQVIMRGFGLSFFDYMAALSLGRGGTFSQNSDHSLTYHPSGQEPHLIVGSRSGLPPKTRGRNQKGSDEIYQAHYFTRANIQTTAAVNQGSLPYADFMAALNQELRYYYITQQVKQDTTLSARQVAEILTALTNSDDWSATLASYKVAVDSHFNLADYSPTFTPTTLPSNFQGYLIKRLTVDINSAAKGNRDNPLSGSLDLLRDLRDTVRWIVGSGYFTPDDYQRCLTEFKSLDNHLSVGPPLRRSRQLLALIEAGIIEVMAPGLKISVKNGTYVAEDMAGNKHATRALIEARLAPINFQKTVNPLVAKMNAQGWLSPDKRIKTSTGHFPASRAIEVNPSTFALIDQAGNEISNCYCYGVPLEGEKWFTTVIPRPGVDSLILREAARIAEIILNKKESG